MPGIYPERTWYQETVLWIGCSYKSQQARFCVQSWVNKDLSLVRGKAYRGKAHLELYPSDLEEHTNLEIREVLDGYYIENGCTITGGKVIFSWV
jgi:hypothetical protein